MRHEGRKLGYMIENWLNAGHICSKEQKATVPHQNKEDVLSLFW